MKRFLYSIILALPLLVCCTKEESAVDTSLRASLWAYQEQEAVFTKKGLTLSGNAAYRAVVTIVSGSTTADKQWSAEIAGNPTWAKVEKIKLRKDFDGTYEGEDMQVWYDGVSITVEQNLDRARKFTLVITTSDGDTFTFPFLQEGLQDNPEILYAGGEVEMMFVQGEETIPFATNTPDEVSCLVDCGSDEPWLTVKEIAGDYIVVEAVQNDDEAFDRKAIITLVAGNETTIQASAEVVVKQLKKAEYWFVYGSGVNDGMTVDGSIRLEEVGNEFRMTAWFEGENDVLLTHNSRKGGYPYYALAADGSIVEIADESTTLPEPPAVDINGMKTLKLMPSDMKWSFDRITTQNCCPDSEAALYPTKDYPTASGSNKTWMTVSLHWNGGDIEPYKLGSGLVPARTTGGYGEAASFDFRDSRYDTRENQGVIDEVPGLADKWGRLYSIYEALTGEPGGALSPKVLIDYPFDNTITDAVGRKYTNLVLHHNSVKNAGDDQAVEQTYPVVKAQIQGICPYGWHIANLQDWRDLFWAASQVDGSIEEVSYATMADGVMTGAAPMLLSKEFGTYRTNAKAHAKAEEFGFGLFPQGWRLYKTGYDYGPGTTDPRFYTFIPLMGSVTSNVWRVQYGGGNNLDVNSTFNIGNVSGCAVRCVKNYR